MPIAVVVWIEPPVRVTLPVDSSLIPAAPCPLVLTVNPSAWTTELAFRTSTPMPAVASALVFRFVSAASTCVWPSDTDNACARAAMGNVTSIQAAVMAFRRKSDGELMVVPFQPGVASVNLSPISSGYGFQRQNTSEGSRPPPLFPPRVNPNDSDRQRFDT
ncbi:hypothetical protein D3C71_1488620 [compost metagenome]